jgi:hypothetical protein
MKPFSIPEGMRNEHIALANWAFIMSGSGIAFRNEETWNEAAQVE